MKAFKIDLLPEDFPQPIVAKQPDNFARMSPSPIDIARRLTSKHTSPRIASDACSLTLVRSGSSARSSPKVRAATEFATRITVSAQEIADLVSASALLTTSPPSNSKGCTATKPTNEPVFLTSLQIRCAASEPNPLPMQATTNTASAGHSAESIVDKSLFAASAALSPSPPLPSPWQKSLPTKIRFLALSLPSAVRSQSISTLPTPCAPLTRTASTTRAPPEPTPAILTVTSLSASFLCATPSPWL